MANGLAARYERETTREIEVDRAITQFSQNLSLKNEMDELKPEHRPELPGTSVGLLVQTLVKELQAQARPRPHPSVFVSMGISGTLLLSVVFSAGILYQRITVLEQKVNERAVDAIVSQKVDSLQSEFNTMNTQMIRLTDRLDKYLDRTNRTDARERSSY